MHRHRFRTAAVGAATRQRGVVLLVVLLLLLLTTVISYQVMETSSLQARMAVARQGKEVSFQSAESIIAQVQNDFTMLESARLARLTGAAWPTDTYTFAGESNLNGAVEVRWIGESHGLGSSLGLVRYLHYEMRASAGRSNDDRLDSLHVRGVKLEGLEVTQ